MSQWAAVEKDSQQRTWFSWRGIKCPGYWKCPISPGVQSTLFTELGGTCQRLDLLTNDPFGYSTNN